jgi:hypothetical protein
MKTERSWFEEYIADAVEKFLRPAVTIRTKALWEARILWNVMRTTDRKQAQDILKHCYQASTIHNWIELGRRMAQNLYIQFIEQPRTVKPRERKRGYSDHGSMPSNRSIVDRQISRSKEVWNMEEQRKRILQKQMELFERNLDKLLALSTTSPDSYQNLLTSEYEEARALALSSARGEADVKEDSRDAETASSGEEDVTGEPETSDNLEDEETSNRIPSN